MTGGRAATDRNQRVVASYTSYVDAQRAVDFLSDRRFPVERISIVGHNPQLVEHVVGRFGYRQAAVSGATSGALFGALFGWVFGIFNWVDPLISGALLALYGLVIGAAFGALIGVLAHAMSGGRRDFASIGGMRAERYDVLADGEVAEDAARLLAELGESAESSEPVTAPRT